MIQCSMCIFFITINTSCAQFAALPFSPLLSQGLPPRLGPSRLLRNRSGERGISTKRVFRIQHLKVTNAEMPAETNL